MIIDKRCHELIVQLQGRVSKLERLLAAGIPNKEISGSSVKSDGSKSGDAGKEE